MVYDQELAGRVRAVLAERPGVDEKRMFGGVCFMVAGRMCCGVLKDDFFVRVGAERLEAALAEPYARPMDFTGRPSMGMVYVAAAGLAEEQTLDAWVQRGVDFVNAHPRTAKRAATAG